MPARQAIRSTGIVLAGGSSSRMGRDKALLDWNGGTLIDHIVKVVGSVVDEVLLVVDRADRLDCGGARIVVDRVHGCGPLAGLHAGLHAARGKLCFVCSCDMPLLQPALVEELLERLPGHDAVIPVTQQGAQPLCAAYDASVLALVERRLQAGELAMRALVDSMTDALLIDAAELRCAGSGPLCFTNLNTPGDYDRAMETT